MRWNTVLFDLDGTVTDPKEGITCAVAYALRQQGIIADPDTLTPFIGPPLHESFPELFGLTEEQTDRAIRDFRVYFSRQGWAENIPYQGMAEFLESLQKAGQKLVIATSKPEEFALRIMEHFGLAAYFHRICGAQREDRASARKGSVVADALRRSGTDGPAVMVGDRRFSTATAAGRNWKTPEPTIWPPIFTSSSSFCCRNRRNLWTTSAPTLPGICSPSERCFCGPTSPLSGPAASRAPSTATTA